MSTSADGLAPAPTPTRPKPTPRQRLLTFGLYVAGGLTLALAWVHPHLDFFAWPALIAVAAAVARTRNIAWLFLGTWLAGAIARHIGLPWLVDMNRIALGHDPVDATATAIGQALIASVSSAVSVALAAALTRNLPFRGRVLPVAIWFPAAWLFGEYGTLQFVGVSNEAWLTTLWTFEPALRLLAHLGWVRTCLLLIFVCSATAEAIITRRPRWALATLIVPAALLLPRPTEGRTDLLEGIAAIHVADDVTLPHTAPPGEDLRLVIWPEDTRQFRPFIKEGGNAGARVPRPLPGSDAIHLMGLITRSRFDGFQNQILAVDPEGHILGGRAKRLLMLLGERRLMGIGNIDYTPGRLSTAVDVAGRRVIALICGELFSRSLVSEGIKAGADVLVVAARDHILVGARARRHMLAVQVLRSVEYGVPSVRASLGGQATIVAADGRVLAVSSPDTNGFLMWDTARGARDVDFRGRAIGNGPTRPKDTPAETVVLYSNEARHLRTACPEGTCRHFALEELVTDSGVKCPAITSKNLIIAGHGKPPTWLSHGPDDIAAVARCFKPELVVIDTCFGAGSELLAALSDLKAIVVAATTLVPVHGFNYPPAFFTTTDPEARASLVTVDHGELLRWPINPTELTETLAAVDAMPAEAIAAYQVLLDPPLIAVPLGDHGKMLVRRASSLPLDQLPGNIRRPRKRRLGREPQPHPPAP